MSDPRILNEQYRNGLRHRLNVERPTHWGEAIKNLLDHIDAMDAEYEKMRDIVIRLDNYGKGVGQLTHIIAAAESALSSTPSTPEHDNAG